MRSSPAKWFRNVPVDDRDRALLAANPPQDFKLQASYLRKIVSLHLIATYSLAVLISAAPVPHAERRRLRRGSYERKTIAAHTDMTVLLDQVGCRDGRGVQEDGGHRRRPARWL